MSESKESPKAFERYQQIVDLLNSNNDKKGLKYVQDLVNKCREYVTVVANAERIGKLQRFRSQTSEEEREEYKRLDQLRRIIHNALIAQLKLVNRYIFRDYKEQIPIGGIYSLDPSTIENRTAVGDWAYYLFDSLVRRGIVRSFE